MKLYLFNQILNLLFIIYFAVNEKYFISFGYVCILVMVALNQHLDKIKK